MTLLEVIERWTGLAGEVLIDLLGKSDDPRAAEWIAKLQGSTTAEALAELAGLLPREILNVVQGKLDARSHPSDAA